MVSPFGRLVPVPALLISEDHFHNIITQLAEGTDQFRKHQEIGDGTGKALPGNLFRRRQLPPVGFADQEDSSGEEALRQKFDGAGDSASDPRGAETGRHARPFRPAT